MKLKTKLFSAALAAGLILGSASVSNATNGYAMIGTGAKSLGMAGAVVANPQDASTIIQNPAGIAWLAGTTVDIGGAAFIPTRKLNGHDSDSNLYVIPSAGLAVNPLGCNCDTPHWVYGIGMYGVSGMGVDWQNSNGLTGGALTKAWSSMQMMEMSAGGAYRNGSLSIGFAPVFVYQALGLEYNFNMGEKGGVYKASLDNANAYGVGFDLGAVYKVNDMLQVGLTYKSKRYMQKLEWNTTPDGMMISADKVKMRLNMPRQITLGINLRPVKCLKIEADVKWINYHDVMNNVGVIGMNALNPYYGTDENQPMMVPMSVWPFHWKNQWVFAVGAEYDATNALTLRAGFNYGKSPIKDQDLLSNIVAPAVVQTHATVGASYKFNKNLEFSFAYVHAFEHKQSTDVPPGAYQSFYGPKVEAKMHQDTVAAQLTYNF
jgi:long-chain fatty acid transport protein